MTDPNLFPHDATSFDRDAGIDRMNDSNTTAPAAPHEAVAGDLTTSLDVILERSFAAFQAATRAVTPVRRLTPTTGTRSPFPDFRLSATA